MVTRPQDYIAQLARAGADFITLHPETINGQAFRLIDEIRRHGMKVGLILNPETPVEAMKYYIHKADKITVMTVDPGFAGQPFIPEMLDKVAELKAWRERKIWSTKLRWTVPATRQLTKTNGGRGGCLYRRHFRPV